MGREAGEVKTNLQIQTPKAKTSATDFQFADKPSGNFHKLLLTWGSNNVLQTLCRDEAVPQSILAKDKK